MKTVNVWLCVVVHNKNTSEPINRLWKSVVRVIWHKTASPPQMDGSIVIARWCQWALPCAHWRHLSNVIELVVLSPHQSPQPKWQIDCIHFCTTHSRKSLYFTMGNPALSPKIALSHLSHDSLGQSEHTIQNGITIGSVAFAQVTTECPYTLQWDAPFLPQNAPSHAGSGPPSNTWFPGPVRVLSPNGILIDSAVFPRITSVTDWPRYLVGSNRLHRSTYELRSTGDAV